MTIPHDALWALLIVVIGLIGTHAYAQDRERRKEQRKADAASAAEKTRKITTFTAFLEEWKAEIVAGLHPTGPTYYGNNIHVAAYEAKLPKFHAAVAAVEIVFAGNSEFTTLTDRINGLKASDWQQCKDKCQTIVVVFEDFLAFLRQKQAG